MDKRVFREKFPGYTDRAGPVPHALNWPRQRERLLAGDDKHRGGIYHWGYCVDCLEPDRRVNNSVTFNPCWPCLCLREGYTLRGAP